MSIINRRLIVLVAVLAGGTAISARAVSSPFSIILTPRPGDVCIVCNKPIGPGDKVYSVDGQRMPVHAEVCDAALHANPSKYLAKIRPQGNQFLDAESAGKLRPSWHWLAVGAYVLAGLIFGGLASYEAVNRGLPALGWFFAGLFFNLPGYLALVTRHRRPVRSEVGGVPGGMTKVPVTHAPRPCPCCGAPNHPAAARCASCGSGLKPQVVSDVVRAGM